MIGTAVWAVLLSFSAVVNGVLALRWRDEFLAWGSLAQLVITWAFLVLTVVRWRNRKAKPFAVKSS